jgi:hypothetical protein
MKLNWCVQNDSTLCAAIGSSTAGAKCMPAFSYHKSHAFCVLLQQAHCKGHALLQQFPKVQVKHRVEGLMAAAQCLLRCRAPDLHHPVPTTDMLLLLQLLLQQQLLPA